MEAALFEEIRRALDPGEQVGWWGRPRQGFAVQGRQLLTVPFAIVWMGFVSFWEYSVIESGAPLLFKLWGIPFIAVGLYLLFGSFIVDMYVRRNTYYAVTNRRVLIVGGLFNRSIRSVSLNGLQEMSLSEGRSGDGTIVIGPQPDNSRYAPAAHQQRGAVLAMVPDARKAYEQIRAFLRWQ